MADADTSARLSLDELRSFPRHTYIVAAVAALGGLLFGYDIGVISGAENLLKASFHLDSGTEELAVAAVLIGSVLGGLVGGKLADRISRRRALLVMAAIYGTGALLTAIAPDLWWFFAFRVFTGIAVGASSMIVPMYIAEMAPVRIRGSLVVLQQVAIAGGILVSYIIAYLYNSAGWGWRPMFATAVLPAVALAAGMLFLDYSPRWLALHDRWNEADTAMGKVDPSHKDDEMALLHRNVDEVEHTSWRDLFTPGLRGALTAAVGLALFQQFVGPNTVLFYTPTIFRFAGLGSSNSLLSTIYVGAALFAFVFVAIALVDVIGRKKLFYFGLSGMALMLVFLGLTFRFGASHYGPYVLAILLVYVACYSMSISPLFWLMSAEVFPNRLRGLGSSYATVANWGANLLVTVTYLTSTADIGKDWTFWMYAALAVGALFFVRFAVPETKARPLENIEAYWTNGHHWPAASDAA